MTLENLIQEIGEIGVKNPRITADLKRFINRAQRRICERRNWTWMHDRAAITLDAGETEATLGSTFKQLSAEYSPVTYTNPTSGIPFPVKVVSRAEAERMGYYRGVYFATTPPSYLPIQYCFIEQNGPADGWVLAIPPQYVASEDVVFNVSAYWFPTDLALGTDSNALTNHGELGDALINLTKSIAYAAEDPTDERARAAFQLYDLHFRTAAAEDARTKLSGRATHW